MRVLYDISVLSYGYGDSRDRTGLFRVVENLAYGLRAASECDLQLVSMQNMEAALKYIASNPRFAGTVLPDPRNGIRKAIDRVLQPLNTRIYDATGAKKLCLRLERKLLVQSAQFLELFSPTVDKASLYQAEIFHSPFSALPRSIRQTRHLKKFLTVYDLSPILYPQFFEFVRKDYFAAILKSLRPDDWAFCISESTKHDLCDYLGIPEERVFVTYPAAEPHLFYPCQDSDTLRKVQDKYHLPDTPYLLSLSALEPRKNLERTIRAFVQLVQDQHIHDLCLVLAGPRVRLYDKILAAVEESEFKSRIILTDYVADSDLAALYGGALAFVYFSLYEGFGLPPLEAMQCGIPVITSNTSSLPEVVGNAGIMLNPTDLDGLSQSMWDIYSNRTLRERMAAKSLIQSKKFSWHNCTRETLRGYRVALDSGLS